MANILIGCECSDTLCSRFRAAGHNAWSCDLKESETGSPFHIVGDVFDVMLDRGPWDLIILHPECTAMAVSGNKHYAKGMPKAQERIDAVHWTMGLWRVACCEAPMVALENPASVIFPHLRKAGATVQYIQPHGFGHPEFKNTGFALHGLPKLVPTNQLEVPEKGTDEYKRWERVFRMAPGPDRATDRSRTYPGIGDAIVDQWGKVL